MWFLVMGRTRFFCNITSMTKISSTGTELHKDHEITMNLVHTGLYRLSIDEETQLGEL